MAIQVLQPTQTPRAGVVLPRALDRRGECGPTPGHARGPRWRRTSKGFYVPADVDSKLPEQRIVEAAAVLPPACGVTGWAALRWHGGRWFDGLADGGRTQRPVVLATASHDIRAQPGISVSQERLDPRELEVVDALPVTSAVRSVCFEMRYAANVRWAVVRLDMAAYDDLVSVSELGIYAAAHQGWTGIPQCRQAYALADENSWSPHESLMRLIWVLDAGLPRPLANTPVFDRSGQHIGTPDLLDVEVGLVGEYDGAHHLDAAQRFHDVNREERFRGVGLEYVTMLSGDGGDPVGFVARLHGARRRARRQAESTRAWTLTAPPWWTHIDTVVSRRLLSAPQRARRLRGRGAA